MLKSLNDIRHKRVLILKNNSNVVKYFDIIFIHLLSGIVYNTGIVSYILKYTKAYLTHILYLLYVLRLSKILFNSDLFYSNTIIIYNIVKYLKYNCWIV